MGYMGFGMQSWVYKRQPRKPFSKRGQIPSFTPLLKYSRTFQLKPQKKKSKYKNAFLSLLVFLSLVFLFSAFTQKLTFYNKNYNSIVNEEINRRDNEAYHFLLNSGKKRLLANNIVGAYSEFNLAYNIKPNNEELNQLIIETLSILCSENIEYCDVLDSHLEKTP